MSHQPPRCPSGYSAFTAFIASDDELSVYRKFRSLSSRNLLYLQSELRVLEAELEAIDAEDLKEELSSDTPRRVAQCFETLELEQDSTDDLKKRMKLIRRIRELMKDYQKALLRHREVLQLQTPSKRVMEVLCGEKSKWRRERPLVGLDWDLFEDGEDLAALNPAKSEDRLSVFLQDNYGHLFQKKESGGVHYFPESYIIRITTVVTIIATAVLMVAAIAILYFVRSMGWRLGILAIFTSLFAICVSVLTNARRAEVFAATAGYAAVLVVFMGSGT